MPETHDHDVEDRYIKIEEAARILAVSKSWIYHRRNELPFVKRLPDGPLRVSLVRLKEWMRRSE